MGRMDLDEPEYLIKLSLGIEDGKVTSYTSDYKNNEAIEKPRCFLITFECRISVGGFCRI